MHPDVWHPAREQARGVRGVPGRLSPEAHDRCWLRPGACATPSQNPASLLGLIQSICYQTCLCLELVKDGVARLEGAAIEKGNRRLVKLPKSNQRPHLGFMRRHVRWIETQASLRVIQGIGKATPALACNRSVGVAHGVFRVEADRLRGNDGKQWLNWE